MSAAAAEQLTPEEHVHTEAACRHEWEACLTPPDSASRWYRCGKCRTFGYRWRGGRRLKPYTCGLKGCKRPAIDLLPGRGKRHAYRWRCVRHLDAQGS